MANNNYPLPVEIEHTLADLAGRIALRRRMLGLTQADLARRVGIGLSSVVALERGAPGVALGTLGRVLWGLNCLEHLDAVAALEPSDALLEERIDDVPKRIRSRKRP